MALDPAADHGGKLAELQIEPAVIPGRPADKVLVEPRFKVLFSGIEPAVQARLQEPVKMGTQGHVDEQAQARIEEALILVEQTGRALINIVAFQVQQAGQLGVKQAIRTPEPEQILGSIQKRLSGDTRGKNQQS